MTRNIIIVLVILVVYLYYQQTKALSILDNQQIQDLQQQVVHYQTLYQKRVEKDLGMVKYPSKEIQTEDLAILSDQDKGILQKVQEFRILVENTESHNLDRNQMNEIEKLTEQITNPDVKNIANQVVTDSAFILGHRNLLKKLADKENELEQVRQKINQQLRQINILFDDNAKNYETIDFNGLLSLLQQVAERERERERERAKSKWPFSRSNIQSKEETKEIATMKQTIQDLNQKIINLQLGKSEELEEKDRKVEELETKLKKKKS